MPVAFACLVTTILSASVYHCDVTPTVMGLLLSIKHLLFERVSASLILGSGAFSCFVVFWFFFPFPPTSSFSSFSISCCRGEYVLMLIWCVSNIARQNI